MEETPFFTRQEAARYLRVSVSTLERWAATDEGPPMRKHGNKAVYEKGELDAWSEASKGQANVEGCASA